ncbi:neuroplastin-like isoform X2 [Dermacentor variabilis]|uniref:neuroplastin-like isoform X2 n=1 Tax=Dermacentor variabilis TaxID=34621 RepID=UPI003F5BA432
MFYALLAWVAATSLPRLLPVAGAPFDAPEDEELWSLGAGNAPHYSERLVTEGEPFSLSCRLRPGLGAGSWLKDGRSIDAAAGYELREQHASGTSEERVLTLTVRDSQVSHTGEYSCVNGVPFRYHHVIIMPKESSRDLGNPREFNRCITLVVGGTNTARLSWLVGGVPLASSRSRARLSGSAGVRDSLLTLSDVAPADSGEYTCRALDGRCPRAAAATTSLHVWPHGVHTNEELPGAGKLIRPFDAQLTLSCWLPDAVESAFNWSKDGVPLTKGDRVSTTGGTLIVKHPGQSDAGVYECKHSDSNITVSIQVRYKVFCYLDWEASAPEPSHWISGKPARLAVQLTGWPPARIVWLRDGVVLSPSDRVHLEAHNNVSKAVLVVEDAVADDRGNYSCLASNGFDADRFDVMVRVRSRYAFVIPLSGIGIEIFLLLAIIALSELRKRRSRGRHRRALEAAPPAAAPVQAQGAGKRA